MSNTITCQVASWVVENAQNSVSLYTLFSLKLTLDLGVLIGKDTWFDGPKFTL